VSRRVRPRLEEHHRRRFERLVELAMRRLPPEIASYLDNVAILIADEPTAEQLGRAESGEDDVLFGLYEGVPLTERSYLYAPVLPDRITLFRRTFEQECAGEAELLEEIRRTILHEIGHHAGFGEDRLKDL
jgi:predicted Zn-dependent protease with MMP-like domain